MSWIGSNDNGGMKEGYGFWWMLSIPSAIGCIPMMIFWVHKTVKPVNDYFHTLNDALGTLYKGMSVQYATDVGRVGMAFSGVCTGVCVSVVIVMSWIKMKGRSSREHSAK
ncbi:hypothetical protein B9479_008374 [Cryptococcus floricola]|uniref:Uncharacterized protein n=1 Tax=Cryptococcus floricola TaxID=2591691 RepID=A0A5D3AHQ4_9TREE|nr:hypothetical protein B9479_008374 [Cryptococcus floricola]